MAKFIVSAITDKKIWENFVLSHRPQSFLQSWNWGETNRATGKKIFRLGFFENKKLIGVCLLIKENARRGLHLVIPGGPILDWNNRELVKFCLTTIKDLAEMEKVWFIRMRPELIDTEQSRKLVLKHGFIPAPMHLHAENTWVLEIGEDEEKLLAGMRKTTRYLIKKSLKMGLTIEMSADPDYSDLLFKLQKETSRRHKFVGFSEDLFKSQIKAFGEDNQARLFICRKGKITLAAAIIIFYGDTAYYHHSGSVSEFREIPFSYFLQWQIIKEAKKRGMKYYNFWGIAPNSDPRHRFAGVTLFKTGFGGKRIDWLHAQDLPISLKYWLTYLFEIVRRIARRL